VTGTTVYTAYPLWTDDTLCPTPLANKYCAVRSVFCQDAVDVEDEQASLPSSSLPRLLQNQPNPFNSLTWIRYSTASPGRVSIRIYDSQGRLVRTLAEQGQLPESM